MILTNFLEDTDTIAPNDWCRPLNLNTMSGGISDTISLKNNYSGSPENNVKWVKVSAVFGECWFGATLGELNGRLSTKYEMVRGNIPKGSALNMNGYLDLGKIVKRLKYIKED